MVVTGHTYFDFTFFILFIDIVWSRSGTNHYAALLMNMNRCTYLILLLLDHSSLLACVYSIGVDIVDHSYVLYSKLHILILFWVPYPILPLQGDYGY